MQKTVTEPPQDILEESTLPELPRHTHEPEVALQATVEEDILNSAAFESKAVDPTTEQCASSELEPAAEKNPESQKEVKERAAKAVHGFMDWFKAKAGEVVGTENVVGQAVQKICDKIEEVAVKVTDWFISHYHSDSSTESEVKDPVKDSHDLIDDLFRASTEDSRESADAQRDKKEEENEKLRKEHDPISEMLEQVRRAERDKTDSPYFIEAIVTEDAEKSAATGGAYTELIMEGDDLVERRYIEDAEGHLTIQESRVRIAGPKPELATAGKD